MISVCILAKNSAQTLPATLDSTRAFPEVILLDNGSNDETLLIAQKYPNVRIVQHPFQGFGPLRNLAASYTSHDWVLALDTDEIISSELLTELKSLPLNDPNIAYTIPRRNYYNGKWIRGCGWYPDRVIRLYHKKATCFSDAAVHESIITHQIQLTPLTSSLLHTPFRSTAEFLAKMQHYSSLFATQHKDKKASLPKAFFHSLFAFFRSYFIQKGFLLGAEGFIVSLYNSNTTFYKYLKLWEKN